MMDFVPVLSLSKYAGKIQNTSVAGSAVMFSIEARVQKAHFNGENSRCKWYYPETNRHMSEHKLNSLEDLGSFVFSTHPDFEYKDDEIAETPPPAHQYLEAHFSRKGRAGKTVTIIKGFKGSSEALKKLSKMLKTKCGVGGAVKEKNIIIQGNHRKKVMEILTNEGYNVKRVGG